MGRNNQNRNQAKPGGDSGKGEQQQQRKEENPQAAAATTPNDTSSKPRKNGGGKAAPAGENKKGNSAAGDKPAAKPKAQETNTTSTEKVTMARAISNATNVFEITAEQSGLRFNELESTALTFRKSNPMVTPGAMKAMYGAQMIAPREAAIASYMVSEFTRVPADFDNQSGTMWLTSTGVELVENVVRPTKAPKATIVGTMHTQSTFSVLWDTTSDSVGDRLGTTPMPLERFAQFSVVNVMLATIELRARRQHSVTAFKVLENSPLLHVAHLGNGSWENLRYVVSLLHPKEHVNNDVLEKDSVATMAIPPPGSRRAGYKLSRPMMYCIAWWCGVMERKGLGPAQTITTHAAAAAASSQAREFSVMDL
jgi:hypothetical protein